MLLLGACSRGEYNTPNGTNMEMTLFEEEIRIPIGQVGPVTVKDLLSSNQSIEKLFSSLLQEDSDGTFYVECDDPLYSMNAYRQALDIPDPSQPYHWNIGSQYGSVASKASVLKMVNMAFTNQQITIYATNPVLASLGLSTDIWFRCRNADSETYTKEFNIVDYSLRSSYSPVPIVQFKLPEDVTDLVSYVELNDLALDLPAKMAENIRPSNDAKFSFYASFRCNVVPSPKFSIAQSFAISNLNVPLGKFRLHKCQLSFDVENTLPFDVTVRSIRLRDEKGDVIPDVVFSSDVKITGGKPGQPAVSPVVLQVEAKEGTIPDLREIVIDIKMEYSQNAGQAPLSSLMGLALKSSFLKLNGGITLFGK